MNLLWNDDYKNKKEAFIEAKKVRYNPEERWTNRLFLIGLVVEAVAIIYAIGFSINLSTQPDKEFYFYQSLSNWRLGIYIITLISLLLHQTYIRNNLKEVNTITTEKFHEDNPSEIFPDNLMFSTGEYFLRNCYFVLLAVIAGEIPYFFMVGEKIIVQVTGQGDYMVYSLSTKIFIFCCFFLCLTVFLWDLLLITSFNRMIKKDPKSNIQFDKGKFKIFILSDVLSLGLWICICLFVLTQDKGWIDDILFSLAIVYSAIIIGVRFIYKKTNPKKGF